MKHMPKWLVVTGYIAGIILMIVSTVLTAILFESMASGTWMGKMFSVAGISVDIGKIVTASAFVYYLKKKQYRSSLLPAILYIFCFIISMVASQSLDLNKANTIKNETILHSDAYKLNISTFENANENIAYYREKIAKIESSESQRIKEAIAPLLKEKAAAKNKRWLTTPAGSPRRGVDVIEEDIANVPRQVKDSIRAEIQHIESMIAQASQSQSSSKSNIDSMKSGTGIKTTEGLIAFAEWWNPQDPNSAIGKFYLFKNIFCEILGTYLIVFMNPRIAISRKRAEIDAGCSDELSKKRVNNSSSEKTTPSKEEINSFISVKKKYPNIGYKDVAERIGVSHGKSQAIQKYLKEKGVLIPNGNTYKVG